MSGNFHSIYIDFGLLDVNVCLQSKKKPPPKGKQSPKGRKAGDKEQAVALKGPRPIETPTEDKIDKGWVHNITTQTHLSGCRGTQGLYLDK